MNSLYLKDLLFETGNPEMMQLFLNHKIRTVWSEDGENWCSPIVDVGWMAQVAAQRIDRSPEELLFKK